jgi:prephenate dehydrogenase
MHIVAAAVCDDAELFQCRGFEGGSFRDVTRVAALDVDMWTELFSLNAPALSRILRRMEDNLHSYRTAVENADVERIRAKLAYSSDRKRRMSLPGPGQFTLEELQK